MTATDRYESLFQCFISEQMSGAQMQQHMSEDEVFRKWVDKRLRERRIERLWSR